MGDEVMDPQLAPRSNSGDFANRFSGFPSPPKKTGMTITMYVNVLGLIIFTFQLPYIAGRWFQIFFIFTPKIGEMIPILTNIFQRG